MSHCSRRKDQGVPFPVEGYKKGIPGPVPLSWLSFYCHRRAYTCTPEHLDGIVCLSTTTEYGGTDPTVLAGRNVELLQIAYPNALSGMWIFTKVIEDTRSSTRLEYGTALLEKG